MQASFRQLERETTRLYEAGEYRAALDLLDARSTGFPVLGHRCMIAFYRACLLAKAGAPDAALDVLEAGLEQGLWWSELMLADADLDPCRGERLERVLGHAAPPEPAARLRDEADARVGVLLALHGGGEVVAADDNPWAPALDAGWAVHRPVSTQRLGAGLATWTNLDLAVEECRSHVDEIGSIDAIGSFSLGGSLALRLISEVIRVPVIMIAPSLRPVVVENAAPNVNGAVIDIITGEHDPYLSLTNKAVDQLRDAGAEIRVDVIPRVAHDFSAEFDVLLTHHLDVHRRRS